MLNSAADIKVSVCVVTYNQEPYIAQCLESIVGQITDFNFEVIVGDDCSTDKTRLIIERYVKLYPDIIKPVFHEVNVGASKNFDIVHCLAKGKYIAHIDGDDYMLPEKLQIQADFMERSPNCNLSWHRMYLQYGDRKLEDYFDLSNIPVGGFSRSHILKYISIGMNSSKMYRAGTMDFSRPNFPMLDYFANVEQVGEGFATFVSPKPLGVYRAGIGIAKNDFKVKLALNNSFLYFLKKYPDSSKEINQAILLLLIAAIINNRYDEVKLYFKSYIMSFSFGSLINLLLDYKFIKTLKLPS